MSLGGACRKSAFRATADGRLTIVRSGAAEQHQRVMRIQMIMRRARMLTGRPDGPGQIQPPKSATTADPEIL
jgi:hypothetical protein